MATGRALLCLWLIGSAWVLLPVALGAQATDPMEGLNVRDIRVNGLNHLSLDAVMRHLESRVGEPFHRTTLALDERRLDELRLFSSVTIEPRLENQEVVIEVTVSETLRILPIIVVGVTDENGVSAGPGVKALNLLGRGNQSGLSFRFGGETSVSATVDATTITPGTWARHVGFSYSSRRNSLYDFDERSTTTDARVGRNFEHGLRVGVAANVMTVDTGSSGASLSPDGEDVIPMIGMYGTLDTLDSSTNPRAGTWAEVEVDRLLADANSWTLIADGRRFQRLSARHGVGLFSLATLQSGEVGVKLPDYLQFALGGANSVRGWSLGSRRGRNQFIGTVEYTYVVQPVRAFSVAGINLYAGLQVVGFGDVGLAWTDDSDFRGGSGIDGYGIGLRVLVPFVDVLRLDLAWGEPGQGPTGYFGVSLKATRQRQRVR